MGRPTGNKRFNGYPWDIPRATFHGMTLIHAARHRIPHLVHCGAPHGYLCTGVPHNAHHRLGIGPMGCGTGSSTADLACITTSEVSPMDCSPGSDEETHGEPHGVHSITGLAVNGMSVGVDRGWDACWDAWWSSPRTEMGRLSGFTMDGMPIPWGVSWIIPWCKHVL